MSTWRSFRVVGAVGAVACCFVLYSSVYNYTWTAAAPEEASQPPPVLEQPTKPPGFVPPPPVLTVNRPDKFGVPYLAEDKWLEQRRPTFSVLVNVYNSARKLRLNMVQLLKMTTGAWELIVLLDGCSDNSLEVVQKVWQEWASWPRCEYPVKDIDVRRVWQSGQALDAFQGDIGHECLLGPSSLVHFRLIVVPGAGLFATAADNLKMRNAMGDYFILVDDDQLMTQYGWNERLVYPLRTWSQVFSVSMRCAHAYKDGVPSNPGLTGPKCPDTLAVQSNIDSERCKFYERDSGNRGPLAIRAEYALKLELMDEMNFLGVVTMNCDHDFNQRAFEQHGWASGFLPIDYTEERCCRSAARNGALVDQYVQWWRERQAKLVKVARPTPFRDLIGNHNKEYTITSAEFDPRCVV